MWAILLLVLGAGLVYAFWPQPVPVDMATASRGPLLVTVDEEGKSRVRDVYDISAPITGRVRRILLDVGDPVVAGKTEVAFIDPVDPAFLDARARAQAEADVRAAEAARSQGEADLKRAEAELDYARAQLDRMKKLRESGTVAQERLDDTRRLFLIREAAVVQAKAELRRLTSALERAKLQVLPPERARSLLGTCGCVAVKAPVSGRVLEIFQKSAGVVASGTKLLSVGNLAEMEIAVDLLSSDAVRVKPGQRVIIEDWGGPYSLAGRVERVEPFARTKVSALGIEEQRTDVIITLTEPRDRWRALGHGYRVEARIVIWEAKDALKAPLGALYRAGDKWAVFVVADGRARQRIVGIGQRGRLEASIVRGLKPGERVVLHPGDRVADGVRVTPRK